MKQPFKNLLGRLMFRAGFDELLLRNAAVVVAFHHVRDTVDPSGLTIGVDTFERYCAFFKQHFDVVSLRDLVENKFYVDEIYDALIIEPLWMFGRALYAFDRWIVDGVINALGWAPQLTGFTLKLTVQRGYLQGYATAMLFGIMVILIILFVR